MKKSLWSVLIILVLATTLANCFYVSKKQPPSGPPPTAMIMELYDGIAIRYPMDHQGRYPKNDWNVIGQYLNSKPWNEALYREGYIFNDFYAGNGVSSVPADCETPIVIDRRFRSGKFLFVTYGGKIESLTLAELLRTTPLSAETIASLRAMDANAVTQASQ